MENSSYLIVLTSKGNEQEIMEARHLTREQKELIEKMLCIDEVMELDEKTEGEAIKKFSELLAVKTEESVKEPVSHDEVLKARKEFPVIILTEGIILDRWDSTVQLAAENGFYTRINWLTNVDNTEKWDIAAAYPISF